MTCMLDYFPGEILHTIFDYLEPNDLFRAFMQIDSYLDSTLYSYHRIQLNFKSIKKSSFYFVCERIHPIQVQSLVLSDDNHTPGQIQLFILLVPLIRCTHLQYLNIRQIHDPSLLSMIMSYLENHLNIRSITVDAPSIQISKKISRSITEILPTLPSLKYLTFMDSSALITLRQPLSTLTHLTIDCCIVRDLQVILRWIPNLLWLKLSIRYFGELSAFQYALPYLKSLMINSNSSIQFNDLENLFSLTPSLRRLILKTLGETALLDGRRWKTLIETKLPYLKELALDISPEENHMTGDDVLIPFQSSFYTTEHHWHMACFISSMSQSCVRLFSIPHFSSNNNWYPSSEGFVDYSLTPYSFDDHHTEIQVSHFPTPVSVLSPYKHIQTLSLGCTPTSIDHLSSVVNLFSVKHLILGDTVKNIQFDELFQAAPNIRQLTLAHRKPVPIFESVRDNPNTYDQITQLNVDFKVSSNDIHQVCRIFPKLQYVSLSLADQQDLFHIFHNLRHLISASIIQSIRWSKKAIPTMNRYLEENSICTDATYYFDGLMLHVWID